mgnify:FL=1
MIDPDLGDELKVTVVATGLGEPVKPSVVVNNTAAVDAGREAMSRAEAEAEPQARTAGGQPDYGRELDRPTVFRQRDAMVSQQSNLALDQETGDPDWIDIPAFLRRQAD